MSNELLFQIAKEFVELSNEDKFKVGYNLGLVNLGGIMFSPSHLEETVFSRAYKQNKLAGLMEQIQRLKNAK